MRFRTRAFLLCFVPVALLLTGSFWTIQKLVLATVKNGVPEAGARRIPHWLKSFTTQSVTVRLPPELNTMPLVLPAMPVPLSDTPCIATLPLTALIVMPFPPAGGAM